MKAPDPMTCHPIYDEQAEFVRRAMDARPSLGYFITEIQQGTEASRDMEPAMFAPAPGRVILTIKRCAGPAPFIGDARRLQGGYVWNVAVDDDGRYVAGESRLDLHERYDMLA